MDRRTLARSYSGAFVDLCAPDWRDVNLDDVARSLSGLMRWNAHTRRPVSVLEHSLVVGRLVRPAFRLAALLHDGHEYMTGDATRPFVAALAAAAGEGAVHAAIEAVKHGLDVAICRQAFALAGATPADPDIEARQLAAEMRAPLVKAADDLAGKIEERAFWGGREPTPSEHYPEAGPDPASLRERWLQSVIEGVALRFEGRGT